MATHSPFAEWDTILNEPGLCAAVADRVTFRCTLIRTGTDSCRFQTT
ncbi:ATP-binding protein [Streptomyces kebangsaanensis]|nr:ATP-binding protein [Streptomyces kebangsaanensis]